MTKEVDLLSSLSKSDTSTKSAKTSSDSSKKEGMSLFDSLLSSASKETETKKSETSEKKESNLKDNNSEKNITKNESKTVDGQKESTSKETKNTDNKKDETNTNKNIETKKEAESSTKDIKEEKPTEQTKTSSTSLLDRMIIEAKKSVKTLNNDELSSIKENKNTEKTTSSNKTIASENLDTNKKAESSNSLLDKMISNAKVKIQEGEVNKETKPQVEENLTKENTKVKPESQSEPIKENKVEVEEKASVKDNLETSSKDDKKVNNEEKNETKSSEKVNSSKLNENQVENAEKTKDNVLDSKVEQGESKTQKSTPVDETQTKIVNQTNENEESKNSSKIVEKKEDTILRQDSVKNSEVKQNINDELKSEQSTKLATEEVKETPKKVDTKNSEVQSETKTVDVKNEKVSKDFSKLDEKAIVKEEQRVDIKKDALSSDAKPENTKVSDDTKDSKSLMDRLLDNAKKSTISSKEVNQENTQNTVQQQQAKPSSDVVTNIYLSSQKNSIYNQMLSNKSEGVKIAKEAKSVDDVKKSADVLELGLKNTSVEKEVAKVEPKVTVSKNVEKDQVLDKLAFERNLSDKAVDREISNKNAAAVNASSSTNNASTTTSSNSNEQVINLNVNPSLATSIQSRIIGAQQQMSSMMSDVARNMYENYKPPVTAFRINLFPSQLGQIAILMKNDKENSISISLNMSNSSTLDAFVENQGVLRDALNRNFNNNQTTFNLDFNMQSENSNSQNPQENNKEKQSEQGHSSSDILEAINENQNVGEELNYL